MCTSRECLHKIAPKKFLCFLPLKTGALTVGILMLIVLIINFIGMAIQVYNVSRDTIRYREETTDYQISTLTKRNSYAFSVIACFYSFFLIVLCVWFIVGVVKKQTTIILAWTVLTSIWLGQVVCLIFVLIYLHSLEANFAAWVAALVFAFLTVGILIYLLLVVVGYWLQLTKEKKEAYLAQQQH